MARTTPHLLLSRHHIYYFRLAIPLGLRSHARGRREIRLSLQTRDRRLAIIRAHQLSAYAKLHLWHAIDKKEGGGMAFDPASIRKLNVKISEGGYELSDIKPGEEDLALLLAKKLQGELVQGNPSPAAEPARKLSSITFSELFLKFADERKRGGEWSTKTEKEFASSINLVKELMGDLPLHQITRECMRGVKEDLLLVPPRVRIMRDTKNFPVKFVVDLQKSKKAQGKEIIVLDGSTINNNLGRIHSVFQWARDQGYMTENPVSNMQIKVSDREAKRLPFELDEVKKIFKSPIFLERKYRKPFQYWGPTIAIYGGMRLNEIAQLHLEDIREEHGILVFDVNAKELSSQVATYKKLKTQTSKRLVPVHSKLKHLGLIDYVEHLKRAGQIRLFPELKYKKDEGYGRRLGDWFNNTLLVDLQIKSKLKVFHSLRHNVGGCLQNAGVMETEVQGILGHAHQSESFKTYGTGYLPERLLPAIEKLDYGLEHQPFRTP